MDRWRSWKSPALEKEINGSHGLSLLFATFCIIDLFGVFPIITLPRPIADCGWFGFPLAFMVFGIQIYTAIMLGKCWIMAEFLNPSIVLKSRYPYTALTEMVLGEKTGKLITFLLDVTIFSAGIPNLIVASQNMQIIGLKLTDYEFNLSFCYWLLILGLILCPIMWLGSPKDMKWLASLSVITVISSAVLTWICMIRDPIQEPPVTTSMARPTWESIAIAYGILSFQFDIHPTILSVQVDMECKSKLGRPIIAGFLTTATLFTVTAVIACQKYGNNIYFNILQGLPRTGTLDLDLSLITAQIFLSMVIGTSALFQDIEDKLGVPREFNFKRCLLRSGLVILITFLGESVPRLDLIMGLTGGLLTGPLMFILPPILYAKFRSILHQEKVRSELKKLHLISKYQEAQRDVIRMRGPYHEAALYEIEKQHGLISGGFKKNYRTISNGIEHCLYAKNEYIGDEEIESCIEDEMGKTILKNQVRIEALKLLKKEERQELLRIKLKNYSNKVFSFDECLQGNAFTLVEKSACLIIIALGILATIAATYFSIRNTILYAEFTPSCLMNSTAASYLIDL